MLQDMPRVWWQGVRQVLCACLLGGHGGVASQVGGDDEHDIVALAALLQLDGLALGPWHLAAAAAILCFAIGLCNVGPVTRQISRTQTITGFAHHHLLAIGRRCAHARLELAR